jgi:hypothetical protein
MPISTYIQGENGFIPTVVAVPEQVNNQLTEGILEALTDGLYLSLVSFDNQETGVDSVADAAIKSSTAHCFHIKMSRDAVGQDLLENHLYALDEDKPELQRLIVLTPDTQPPHKIAAVEDERTVWTTIRDGALGLNVPNTPVVLTIAR